MSDVSPRERRPKFRTGHHAWRLGWLMICAVAGCRATDSAHQDQSVSLNGNADRVVVGSTSAADSGVREGMADAVAASAADVARPADMVRASAPIAGAAPSSTDSGAGDGESAGGSKPAPAAESGASGAAVRGESSRAADGGALFDDADGGEPATPPAGAGAPGAARCGGKRMPAGETRRTIRSAGVAREFLMYSPRNFEFDHGAPVLLVFHGALMDALAMRDLSGFEQVADAHGFVAVFPEGDPDQAWNIRPSDTHVCGIGELFTNPRADDLSFVQDMLDVLEREYCIDRGHVFATGFSMGGYFSNHLACQRPDLIRAAAPHSSGTYRGTCHGQLPMLIIHSRNDIAVDPACGVESRELWLERNGCAKDYVVEPIEQGRCYTYRGCTGTSAVEYCETTDACHAWSGHGSGGPLCPDFGSGPDNEDASELIWRFFTEHW